MTIDRDFAQRYRDTWNLAYKRGASLPEELDRARMLLTSERKRDLYQAAADDVAITPPHLMAHLIGVNLESATFTDGLQAAVAWLEAQAKGAMIDGNINPAQHVQRP